MGKWTLWASVLISAACGPSEAPTMTVRDSAGVRIVENHRPSWDESSSNSAASRDPEAWRVARDPLLSLGAMEGDSALSFDRLSGVYVLRDERIAVLDAGAGRVTIFEPEGAVLSTFGRTGEGPGEFVDLAFLGLQADSLWLFDARQLRITVLDPETGGFRVARAQVANAGLGPVGLLPDASPILAADLVFSASTSDAASPGLQRFGAAYIRLDPVGGPEDTVLVAPGSERILRFDDQRVEMLRPLVARSVSHAVRGDEIFQGSQAAFEIGVYGADGTLRVLIRRPGFATRIDEQAYGAAVEQRVLMAPEPARPGLRALYSDLPRPEARPAYAAFLVDSEGCLWVQEFAYDGAGSSWSVFDPQGIWLGTLDLPDRFRPTQVVEDRVVGVWLDDLDVQHARILALDRG
jgi:hypothetical protein